MEFEAKADSVFITTEGESWMIGDVYLKVRHNCGTVFEANEI